MLKKRFTLRHAALASVAVATTMSVLAVTGAGAATLTTVANSTGNAYGVKAAGAVTSLTLALVPVNVPETPSVSTTNSTSTSSRSVASAYVPLACALFTPTCAVNAHALKVSTRNASGANGSSVSTSDVKDISLLFDLVNLKVVHAECRADKAGLTMASSLVATSATSTPLPIPVPVPLPNTSQPAPNTVVPIGAGDVQLGTLTLNEQIDTSTSTRNSGEVNAVHLRIPAGSPLSLTGLDVIVGHVACSASQT